jgi:hypothetical protein
LLGIGNISIERKKIDETNTKGEISEAFRGIHRVRKTLKAARSSDQGRESKSVFRGGRIGGSVMNEPRLIDPFVDMFPERAHLRYVPEAPQKPPSHPFELGKSQTLLVPEQDADSKAGGELFEPDVSGLTSEQGADQKAGGEPFEPGATGLAPVQDADHKAGGEPFEPAATGLAPQQDADLKPGGEPSAPPESGLISQDAGPKPRGRPFEPGKSGNPNGRPKGSQNKATLAIKALLEAEAPNITRRLIDTALEGDAPSLRFLLGRVLPPQRSRTVQFELPPIEKPEDAPKAFSAVLDAVKTGELEPAEGEQIMSLIERVVTSLASVLSAADKVSGETASSRDAIDAPGTRSISPHILLRELNASKSRDGQ